MSAAASSSSAPKKGKKSKSRDMGDAVEDVEEEVVNKNKRHRKDKRQLNPLSSSGLITDVQHGTRTTLTSQSATMTISYDS